MQAIALLFLTTTGCLVTEPITFEEEENFPPTLLDEPGSPTPIGETIRVNLPAIKEIAFTLQVRDENLLQTLKARYEIASPDSKLPISELDVGISGDPVRPFEFSIPASSLREDTCYRLKLAVTSGFKNDPNIWDKPELEGDIAFAKWLIFDEGAVLDGCPSLEYGSGETSP